MSEKPSPLKSPVPIARQAGPGLRLTAPPPIRVVPSISQTETWPVLVFCQRMSASPSLLKSPVPTAFQVGPGLLASAPPPIFVLALISQIEACPSVFCHRMSDFPSPLKSPVPIAFQLGPGLAPAGPPPIFAVPLISQIEAWPLAFCHRMSEWPSLLKSFAAGSGVQVIVPSLFVVRRPSTVPELANPSVKVTEPVVIRMAPKLKNGTDTTLDPAGPFRSTVPSLTKYALDAPGERVMSLLVSRSIRPPGSFVRLANEAPLPIWILPMVLEPASATWPVMLRLRNPVRFPVNYPP